MPSTFFIGDLHFGHEKVSQIRGFKSNRVNDDSIIRKWNKQVKPGDNVYVLGDISGGGRGAEFYALTILDKLPGRKFLISGNHDSTAGVHVAASPNWGFMTRVFDSISDYGRLPRFEGHSIVMSHYPYLESADGPGRGPARYGEFRLPNIGNYLIHAHTHHNDPISGSKTGNEICVSWDAWRRMVDLGDIRQMILKLEAQKEERLQNSLSDRLSSHKENYLGTSLDI